MTEAAKPWLAVTPRLMGKAAVSTVLMAVGMYYLTSGRREGSVSRMFSGALLTVASVVLIML